MNRSPATAALFEANHCYFLNVSPETVPVCTTGASNRLSSLSGPVPKGGEIEAQVEPGPVRLDLLAFEKTGDCTGKFEVDSIGEGNFRAKLDGVAFQPVWLVGTKLHQAVSGTQTVTMEVLGTTEQEMGVPLACDESKKPTVSSVSMSGTDTLIITGSQLQETSRVSLAEWDTKFEIVSATASAVSAKLLSSANVALGSLGTLIVSNAYGQATANLTVTLGSGTVQPSHLDLSQNWPFPLDRTLTYVSAESRDGSTVVTNSFTNAIDGDLSTFVNLDTAPAPMYGGTCVPGNPATDGGYYLFQIGDGSTVYNGVVSLRISYTTTSSWIDLHTAENQTDAYAETTAYVMNTSANSTAAAWKSFLYTGAYIAIKPSCAMGGGYNVKIYEIKVSGTPL